MEETRQHSVVMADRLTILREIKRLTFDNGGRPIGQRAFQNQTGYRETDWLGVFWARWGDALTEAGFSPNEMQGRSDKTMLLKRLAEACRNLGRMPTRAEIQMIRNEDPSFPSYKTYAAHFGGKDNVLWELRDWIAENGSDTDVLELIPRGQPRILPRASRQRSTVTEGYVYLLKSGPHYKIGRSDELEKRVKQISVALPESVGLEHAIKTDDPPGIEAYWHRRFAEKRANGEWFKLTADDVRAFKRRNFQ